MVAPEGLFSKTGERIALATLSTNPDSQRGKVSGYMLKQASWEMKKQHCGILAYAKAEVRKYCRSRIFLSTALVRTISIL